MTVLKISNVRKIFCTYDSYVDLYVSVIFVPRCLSQGVYCSGGGVVDCVGGNYHSGGYAD